MQQCTWIFQLIGKWLWVGLSSLCQHNFGENEAIWAARNNASESGNNAHGSVQMLPSMNDKITHQPEVLCYSILVWYDKY